MKQQRGTHAAAPCSSELSSPSKAPRKKALSPPLPQDQHATNAAPCKLLRSLLQVFPVRESATLVDLAFASQSELGWEAFTVQGRKRKKDQEKGKKKKKNYVPSRPTWSILLTCAALRLTGTFQTPWRRTPPPPPNI